MTKEVTFTTVFMASMEINEDGLPQVVQQAPVKMLGEITKEKAQKIINKKQEKAQGEAVTVYKVETEKQIYRMKVTDFINSPLVEIVETEDEGEEVSEDQE